jgi:hypothetical protein
VGCLYANTHGYTTRPANVAALNGGAIPAIVAILTGHKTEVCENGAATIRNLAILEEADISVSDGGAVPSLVKSLSSSEVSVIQQSCEATKNIC